MVHGGEVSNVIPDKVTLGGTIRDLKTSVFDTVCARMRSIVEGTCAAFGATATVKIDSAYPCVDNNAEQAEAVAQCAARWLGAEKVSSGGLPIMGGEDFSYFLHEKPGCLFFLGGHEATLQGWSKGGDPGGKRSNCMCHNTAFDFNDNLLPIAAVFWVRLVEAPRPRALHAGRAAHAAAAARCGRRRCGGGGRGGGGGGRAGSGPGPAGARSGADSAAGQEAAHVGVEFTGVSKP